MLLSSVNDYKIEFGCDWRYVSVIMTPAMQITLLTTVNAPYQVYLDADGLADALVAGEISAGQVGSFFTEISVEAQKSFAQEHEIDFGILEQTASDFAIWSGQFVVLAG